MFSWFIHITTRVLSDDERNRYLPAASQPLRDVATVMLCGLHPGEVMALTRDNISLDDNYLFVRNGKIKSARRKVFLSSEARKVLEYRLKIEDGELLFPDQTVVKFNIAHTKAVKRSGIEYAKLYAMRHSFAADHVESQTDVISLAQMLGHANLATLMRYGHPSDDHKAEAIRRVERAKAAQNHKIKG